MVQVTWEVLNVSLKAFQSSSEFGSQDDDGFCCSPNPAFSNDPGCDDEVRQSIVTWYADQGQVLQAGHICIIKEP